MKQAGASLRFYGNHRLMFREDRHSEGRLGWPQPIVIQNGFYAIMGFCSEAWCFWHGAVHYGSLGKDKHSKHTVRFFLT